MSSTNSPSSDDGGGGVAGDNSPIPTTNDNDNDDDDDSFYDANYHRAQFFAEATELFLVFNAEYKLVDANVTALVWFGKTRDTMHEIQMVDLCHPDHLARTYQAMADSQPHTNLILHNSNHSNGRRQQYRWMSWRPMKSRHTGYFYAAGRDVTAEIEDKSHAESFVRLLCHEIRNPLLGIMGVCDFMQAQHPLLQEMLNDHHHDDDHPQAQKLVQQRLESVETLHHCCAQLNSVVNTTLNFSKLESGKSELVTEPYQPHTVLQASTDVMMGLARSRNVRLRTVGVGDNAATQQQQQYCLGDQAWLSQVLVNLLSNAIKFTNEGGTVTAQVSIQDNPATTTTTTTTTTTNQTEDEESDDHQPDHPDKSHHDDSSHHHHHHNPPGPSSTLVVGAPQARITENNHELDKLVIFTIQDTGVGMTAAQQKELFQPFMNQTYNPSTQLDGTSGKASSCSSSSQRGPTGGDHHNDGRLHGMGVTNYANCGLGLHISHSVVTRMGGTIQVDSALAKGTTVCVKIPTRGCDPPATTTVRHDHSATTTRTTGMGPSTNTTTSSSSIREDMSRLAPLNILVVDDVRLNRAIAIRHIQNTGGGATQHKIYEACDGVSCLNLVASLLEHHNNRHVKKRGDGDGDDDEPRPPLDLILMDLSMPGIDGLEATRRLRSLRPASRTAPIYIAGVSAFSDPKDREAAMGSGMDNYVVKPYTKQDLEVILWEASARRMRRSDDIPVPSR